MFLGADLFALILDSDQFTERDNTPSEFSNIFGCFIMGKIPTSNIPNSVNSFYISTDIHLEDFLKRFCELEKILETNCVSQIHVL